LENSGESVKDTLIYLFIYFTTEPALAFTGDGHFSLLSFSGYPFLNLIRVIITLEFAEDQRQGGTTSWWGSKSLSVTSSIAVEQNT
jgi:hypothetical protein